MATTNTTPTATPAPMPALAPTLRPEDVPLALGVGPQYRPPPVAVHDFPVSQHPPPSLGAHENWPVVQPGGAGTIDGLIVVVVGRGNRHDDDAQMAPYGQHPPPSATAHRKEDGDGQARGQQVETVDTSVTGDAPRSGGMRVAVVVVTHGTSVALQGLSQFEPIAQQAGPRDGDKMQYRLFWQQ